MRFPTKAVHAGQEPDSQTGGVSVPINMSSTFSLKNQSKYVYGRSGNPTREALEEGLAALEDGTHGLAFSSGLGATTTIATLLQKGDHAILCEDVYGGTYRLFARILSRYGITFDSVDTTRLENVERALKPGTRMIWIETPSNPLLKITDIERVGELAKWVGALLVVDNTFATPYLQQPLNLGADLVLHSTTKYLGGHSDVVGGGVVTNRDDLAERLRFAQNAVGAVPSPFDCWLVLRGIRSLTVRMDRHCQSGQSIANRLKESERIARVYYPGLPEHQNHDIAKKQMTQYGGVVSFEMKDTGDLVSKLRRLELITLAESLGGVESLIEHPATMTHASVPKELREKVGLSDGLVRLSVGLEDPDDLVEDLERAEIL